MAYKTAYEHNRHRAFRDEYIEHSEHTNIRIHTNIQTLTERSEHDRTLQCQKQKAYANDFPYLETFKNSYLKSLIKIHPTNTIKKFKLSRFDPIVTHDFPYLKKKLDQDSTNEIIIGMW
jgi:hypothetical protein